MKATEFHRYEYSPYPGKRTCTRYKMTAATAAERFTAEQEAVPIAMSREVRNLPETSTEASANQTGLRIWPLE